MSTRTRVTIAIASTFTAEPIEDALRFWLSELGFDGDVVHAPYDTVFQQLLDPASVLSRNTGGVNLLLVRLEDWLRAAAHDGTAVVDEAALVRARLDELVAALRSHAARVPTPTWIWLGPVRAAAGDARAAERAALHRSLSEALSGAVSGHGALAVIEPSALDRHAVREVFDPRRDALGHIPYSDEYFTALATVVARRIHATMIAPIKVIAVDCDNTLWQGVVGEEGVDGIRLPEGKLALQRALIAQQQQGIVLCLLSKNAESDVLDVLDRRADMLLRREHLVGHRINWLPKSANIASLASELDLGLDAFVFLDDNPVECAEMRAAYPQVTTVQVPEDHEIAGFIEHLWVFDRREVTEEDRRRTHMYQENAQRTQLQQQATSIAEFLAGLELVVDIGEPTKDELPRVAQLTQRTNQLNFTTRRRSEAELERLAAQGLRCLRVSVRDRFGDYGLVGVMIYGVGEGVLRVDSFMLSCRALGRGVEHAMLARLGAVARHAGASTLELEFSATRKNQPAHDFLQGLRDAEREARGPDTLYRLAASTAERLVYEPGADAERQLALARTGGKQVGPAAIPFDRSRLVQRAATAWRDPAVLLEVIGRAATTSRPELGVPFVAPVTRLHEELASMWASLLHVDRVGIHDDFMALGGTSLVAAKLFARIDERHGVKLPMTAILEDGTIERLARRIESRGEGARASMLRPLRVGREVRRHLFLVHDGDGETLLYMNLARRLPDDVAVYGIEPDGTPRTPIRQTRIADMARRYLQELRRVQPRGPYALGGMCAGGVIAFEMALQLEACGEQVDLVALLDSASPWARKKPLLVTRRRLRSLMGAVRGERPQASAPRASEAADARDAGVAASPSTSPAASIGARLERVAQKLRNTARYEVMRGARYLGDSARVRLLREVMDHGWPVPRWLERLSVRTVYELAEAGYRPRARLNGKAILFRATRGEGIDEPFVQRFEDPSFDWPRWMAHGVSVEDVPGGHGSMLQEPNVQAIAERITAELRTPASGAARDAGCERLLVVIVNYKSAKLTLDALASLEPELREIPGARVTVVENASGDAEALARGIEARGFGGWVTLDASPRNGGFAYGNNRAIRPALASETPPRYVLLLNPDTRIHPGAVTALLEFMDAHPDAGIAGSSFENGDGSDWPIAFRFPTVLSELDAGLRVGAVSKLLDDWVVARTMEKREAQVDWISGACMMIRREVFRDVGLMDEGYFLYHEETDFCLQARRAGWSCWYVPQSRVVHIAGQSTGVTRRDRRPRRTPAYCFESRRRYFLKNHGLAYAVGADLSFGLGFALWRARRAIQRKQDMDPPHHLVDFWRHSVILPGNRRVG